jgi:hypothetical protein
MQCHHDVDQLGVIERDVMEEMRSLLHESGRIERKKQEYRLEERFLFLYAYYRQEVFDKSGRIWQNFKLAQEIRNGWTHPKPPFNVNGPSAEQAKLVIDSLGALLRSMMTLPYEWMWPFGKPAAATA